LASAVLSFGERATGMPPSHRIMTESPMTLELINPEDLPTPPTYTHVIVATGSKIVFIAGQEPEDAHGNLVSPGDLAAQARQALFGDHKPADTVVGVETLANPQYLIEVDAIAVIDR
jgi:enamine deaminase RidA (YjgF/YER057c/UK114 family)